MKKISRVVITITMVDRTISWMRQIGIALGKENMVCRKRKIGSQRILSDSF